MFMFETLQLFISFVLAFLFFSVMIGLGYKISSYFPRLFSSISSQEIIIISSILGVGSVGTIFFFIGLFHLYYGLFFLGGILFLSIVLFSDIILVLHSFLCLFKEILFSKKTLFMECCAVLFFIFLLGNLFSSLTPEVQWDSLVYHLTGPKIYAKNYALVEIPSEYHDYLFKQYDILFVLGEALEYPQISKILSFLFTLLLPLGVYVFSKNVWNKKVAIIAMVIIYTIPNMVIYYPTTYNDVALTIFLFAAIITFFYGQRDKTWLLLCGLFVGFAAATKILAFATLGFFLLYQLFIDLKKTYFSNFSKSRVSFFSFLTIYFIDACHIILPCLLIMTPWMTLTYIQTENPVYPFFYSVIGAENWNDDIEHFKQMERNDYGTGKSILSFLMTPWNLTMHPMIYGPVYGDTPIFLIFIPLSLFLFFFSQQKKRMVPALFFFLLFSSLLFPCTV